MRLFRRITPKRLLQLGIFLVLGLAVVSTLRGGESTSERLAVDKSGVAAMKKLANAELDPGVKAKWKAPASNPNGSVMLLGLVPNTNPDSYSEYNEVEVTFRMVDGAWQVVRTETEI